jgi:hypothetical protein
MSTPPHAAAIDGSDNNKFPILWSCVSRGDVILAEAAACCCGGGTQQEVAQTASELLAKAATPGFEYHGKRQQRDPRHNRPFRRRRRAQLKGIKFHLYEPEEEGDDDDDENKESWEKQGPLRMWVFAAVYDPALADRVQVKSFLEKMVVLTEPLRGEWATLPSLGAQAEFAPILLQRMQELQWAGRTAMLEERLDTSKLVMQRNIEMLLDRGERLHDMEERATRLRDAAAVFRKRSRKVRRMKMWQNAKHGLVLGTAITAGVAVCVVPPLVAIL